jgi:hypothetical protein
VRQRRLMGSVSGVAVFALCFAPAPISDRYPFLVWLLIFLALAPIAYLLISHQAVTRARRSLSSRRDDLEAGTHDGRD